MIYVSVDIDDTTGYANADYPKDPNIEESYPNVSYLVTITVDDESYYSEDTEAEAILDRITYDGYDINIEYTDPDKAVSMRKIYSHLKPID